MTGSGISAQFGMAEETYTNEVQTLTGTPSATFTLTFEGATTTSLATNASAVAIQNALNALPNVGASGVVCSGGPLPSAVTITFSGPLVAGRDVALLVVQSGITGLTPATTTPGSGYGSGATPTRFLEFLDESMKLEIDRIESKGLRSGGRTLRTDRWAAGKRQAGGDLSFELASKGFSMLLGAAFGADAVITTPAGGTSSRDHTFTVGTSDNANRSFVAQLGIPDVNGTVNPFTYVGCKVTDWEIDAKADGIVTVKLSVDAQDETTATGLAAASYPASFELVYWTGGQLQIAGAYVDAKGFNLKGKMSYATDRFFMRSATNVAAQASLKKQPIANDFVEITGQIDVELEHLAHYARYVAGTTAAVVFTAEGSAIEAITGGTARNGIQLSLANCRFDGDTPDVGGADLVEASLSFKALYDGSTAPLIARYRTTDIAK